MTNDITNLGAGLAAFAKWSATESATKPLPNTMPDEIWAWPEREETRLRGVWCRQLGDRKGGSLCTKYVRWDRAQASDRERQLLALVREVLPSLEFYKGPTGAKNLLGIGSRLAESKWFNRAADLIALVGKEGEKHD